MLYRRMLRIRKFLKYLPVILMLSHSAFALPQQPQNPSPMVEHARRHDRLKEERPQGVRIPLKAGNLFVPAGLKGSRRMPILVHFHGGLWIPEVAAARRQMAVITIQFGSGSLAYAKPFRENPELFGSLMAESRRLTGADFAPVTLSGWSAGYGAIREILSRDENYRLVDRILLIDGLHTGYADGKPGPLESQLEAEGLAVFVRFARDAAEGRKKMLVTHSEIFPGTFASTTEAVDYLLSCLALVRTPVLKWGPKGMQQISKAGKGSFRILGFAGNSAPDHVDQLHSLPELLSLF
jgi:hypothetical protein